jgi:glycosyltransferase involved in cell wall biosynthesis
VLELADVLAFPSLPIEGLPTVLVEAGRCGVAVVASDIDGVPEIVEHDATGLLVPPGDPAALAAALERYLGDKALREACGAALAASLRGRFTVPRMAEEYAALYADVAAQRGS